MLSILVVKVGTKHSSKPRLIPFELRRANQLCGDVALAVNQFRTTHFSIPNLVFAKKDAVTEKMLARVVASCALSQSRFFRKTDRDSTVVQNSRLRALKKPREDEKASVCAIAGHILFVEVDRHHFRDAQGNKDPWG